MQQFVVPQFIDVEDKVIGPITVRQFIILLVGAGASFIAYRLSDFVLFLIEFVFILILTVGVAFIRVNGRPVHYFLLNILQTLKRTRIRVWLKVLSNSELRRYAKEKPPTTEPVIRTKNRVRSSRLAEMALIVDTGGVYQGDLLEDENLK